jgi:hypothetical protein
MYTLDSMFENTGMNFFWQFRVLFTLQLHELRICVSYMQLQNKRWYHEHLLKFLPASSVTDPGHVGIILSIVLAHAELYHMPIPLLMSFCFWFLAVLLSWQRHTQVLKGMIWFCSRRLPAICFLHVELSMLSQ